MLADLARLGLSAGPVGRIRGVVHAALAQVVRWDWIWSNPATNATRIDVRPRCHVVPDAAVVTKVLESLRSTDPTLMIFVRLARPRAPGAVRSSDCVRPMSIWSTAGSDSCTA